MVEKQLSEEDIILDDIVTGPYKYGFKTEIETESFPKGLDLNIIQKIIEKKDEPEFLQKFRIRAFNNWQKMESPTWAHLTIDNIDYQDIQYYSINEFFKKDSNFNTIQFQKQKRSWGA